MANIIGWPASGGGSTAICAARRAAKSIRPPFRQSNTDPCPRPNSGSMHSSTGESTGPDLHSIASDSPISASPRRVKQRYSSCRKPASSARHSTSAARSCTLVIAAFAVGVVSVARTHNHAKAACTSNPANPLPARESGVLRPSASTVQASAATASRARSPRRPAPARPPGRARLRGTGPHSRSGLRRLPAGATQPAITNSHTAITRSSRTVPSAVKPDARSLQYRNGHATGMAGATSLNPKLRADATAQVVWACREVAVSRMGPAAGVDMKPIVRWLMAALVAVAAFAVAAWVCGAPTLSALLKDAGGRGGGRARGAVRAFLPYGRAASGNRSRPRPGLSAYDHHDRIGGYSQRDQQRYLLRARDPRPGHHRADLHWHRPIGRLQGDGPVTDQGGTHNAISGGIFFSAVIQGRDITVQLPREITPALSGLPAATPAFTGRQADLDVLLGALAPRPAGTGPPGVSASRTVAVTAVGGLAGVGKTELAVQAAHTVLANGWFPGGVLFADLFGYDEVRRLEPAQALEGFLRALGIPGEHIPPQAQDRARLYASVLAAYAEQGQGVLVVADNVYASEQAEPLLPTDGINAALVTSRDTLGLLNARLLDLDVLTPEAAACMLDRTLRVARPGDSRVTDCPGDAAAIARTCGGLPLALRIIAALLAEDPARPLAAMAADLRDERTRLDEISYANTGVRAAFDLSYQRLDPGHARLFRLLPVNPGPDISTQTAAALTGHDQAVTRRELEALARAHLIEHGSGYGRWRMHDLVRLYADQHGRSNAQADARDEAYIRLLNHYLDTTIAASAHLDPAVADPATREFNEREQALAWLDAEYPNLTSVTYAAASRGHLAVARDLPRAMWHFLSWRRHFNDLITLATIASNAADRLGDPRGEAVARASLAAALHGARRFEEANTAWQHAAQTLRDT